ncbi:MAG: hypothetical protein WC701_08155 [Kiritimatiellales bacterium]|jgi:hypothetical protein
MGNKKTNQEQVAEDVMNILMPIIMAKALMLMASPFYFTYLFILSKIRRGMALSKSTGPRHFWLSPEEKSRFKNVFQAAMDAKKNKEEAIRLAETEGILKNNDGQYSVRSNQGRTIRETINKSDHALEEASKILTRLKRKPHEEWAVVDNYFRQVRGAKWGLIGFFIVFGPLLPAFFSSTGGDAESVTFLICWGYATLFGVLAFYIAKRLPRTPVHRHFDEPPEVNLSNIDTWGNMYSSTAKVLDDAEK